ERSDAICETLCFPSNDGRGCTETLQGQTENSVDAASAEEQVISHGLKNAPELSKMNGKLKAASSNLPSQIIQLAQGAQMERIGDNALIEICVFKNAGQRGSFTSGWDVGEQSEFGAREAFADQVKGGQCQQSVA